MKTFVRKLILFALVAVGLVLSTNAQRTIPGTVYREGKPAAGVTVELHRSSQSVMTSFDGKYELTETNMGVIAVINDLHKGRDTGKAWSAVIDFSAIFMIVISVTGLILLFFLKKKRTNGLLWLVIGGAVTLLFYLLV
jgi:hypothetical protein